MTTPAPRRCRFCHVAITKENAHCGYAGCSWCLGCVEKRRQEGAAR